MTRLIVRKSSNALKLLRSLKQGLFFTHFASVAIRERVNVDQTGVGSQVVVKNAQPIAPVTAPDELRFRSDRRKVFAVRAVEILICAIETPG